MTSLFAQNNVIPGSARNVAAGAKSQIHDLLNNPAMVQTAIVTPLGRNWFRMEKDSHVFTDQVSVAQVSAVLHDLDNQADVFNGRRAIISSSIVREENDGTIVDLVVTSVGPLNIRIRTPYRVLTTTFENNETKAYIEMRQLDSDSASNDRIKNFFGMRYVEAVNIDGKYYTYIRIFNSEDVNGSFLPGARSIFESQIPPTCIEALELVITAARNR